MGKKTVYISLLTAMFLTTAIVGISLVEAELKDANINNVQFYDGCCSYIEDYNTNLETLFIFPSLIN